MTEPAAVAAPRPHVPHDDHHEALGFWRKYVFSTDHKVIGIQYGITGLLFLFFGFSLMMLMRWQLAYPGAALPLFGRLLGDARMPGGTMLPEFYNQLGAMHGTIMVFPAWSRSPSADSGTSCCRSRLEPRTWRSRG